MVVRTDKKPVRPVKSERDIGSYAGILSLALALAGLFFLSEILVPVAIALAVFALMKNQIAWGTAGLVFGIVGIFMSPSLMQRSGLVSIMPHRNAAVYGAYPGLEKEEEYASRKQQAVDAMYKAISDCRDKRINGELKTYADSAKCSEPLIMEAFRRVNYPYMDLIEELNAKRLELAEKLDKGELTEDEVVDEDDALLLHIHDEAAARDRDKADKP